MKNHIAMTITLLLSAIVGTGCDVGKSDSSAQSSSTIFDDQIQAHQTAQDLEKDIQEAAAKRDAQMP
ncbi:hypothetical protein QWI17_10970 [Gilvimarinus sp. SDUM040013]|uniref:Secreted protein n=1 Tax=Gilvimarinus gilvus TaxID=3058038 RepID=A0ABU4S0E8_9GAMM|nr:hypothetical protein [Gilvimarinus sp. SDUM040013]MDO3386361.1 hypothetical protein [Gilvimarinus sp. SDUM040013]MDX6849981.1 hypothetical protein [Gilvimarinus sp. SDUM040013]